MLTCAETTMTSEGEVTLPEEVRKHLHLRGGDRVEFLIKPGGEVQLRSGSAQEIFGMLHRSDIPPRTLEELREGMIAGLVEDNERIKRGGE